MIRTFLFQAGQITGEDMNQNFRKAKNISQKVLDQYCGPGGYWTVDALKNAADEIGGYVLKPAIRDNPVVYPDCDGEALTSFHIYGSDQEKAKAASLITALTGLFHAREALECMNPDKNQLQEADIKGDAMSDAAAIMKCLESAGSNLDTERLWFRKRGFNGDPLRARVEDALNHMKTSAYFPPYCILRVSYSIPVMDPMPVVLDHSVAYDPVTHVCEIPDKEWIARHRKSHLIEVKSLSAEQLKEYILEIISIIPFVDNWGIAGLSLEKSWYRLKWELSYNRPGSFGSDYGADRYTGHSCISSIRTSGADDPLRSIAA